MPQLKVPQIGGGQSQPETCGIHPTATHGRTQSPRLHRRAEIHTDNQAMTTEHETKCCGSCRHFANEDALGLGWCTRLECETTCGGSCNQYENKNNQKTTEDNRKQMETREIKFRGKDADNDHEWKYGSLIVCPDGSPVIVCFDDDGCELSYDVVPATVG